MLPNVRYRPIESHAEVRLAKALVALSNAVRDGETLDKSALSRALREADRLLIEGQYAYAGGDGGAMIWIGS